MITVELSPPAVPNGVIITYSVLVNETVVGMIQLSYLCISCKKKKKNSQYYINAFSGSIEFNLCNF